MSHATYSTDGHYVKRLDDLDLSGVQLDARPVEDNPPPLWNDALADAWITLLFERIGVWHDEHDGDVNSSDWDDAEHVVDEAYRAQHRDRLRLAIARYEDLALRAFIAAARARRPARHAAHCPTCPSMNMALLAEPIRFSDVERSGRARFWTRAQDVREAVRATL